MHPIERGFLYALLVKEVLVSAAIVLGWLSIGR